MVNYKIIEKSINDAVTKCNTASKEKKLGATGESVYTDDEYGYHYEDGTQVMFNIFDDSLSSVVIDGKEYVYPNNECYNMFNFIKEELEKTVDGEVPNDFMREVIDEYDNDWYSLKEYSDDFASWQGWGLNRDLRNGVDNSESRVGLWLNHDWFTDLEKTMRVDREDFACMRITSKLHDSDNIDKKVISDKAHYSTTVGGDMEKLLNNFGTGDFDYSWKHITVVDKDCGLTGLFLGTALQEKRGTDWEAELNIAPKQKFERLLIDEEHKIVIQKPLIS